MRVLVIEDDPAIGKALVKGFTEAGYQCDWMQDGEVQSPLLAQVSAGRCNRSSDQMLPKMSGMDLLREISYARQRHDARHPADGDGFARDRITGLNTGQPLTIEIPKPFDFAELLARLNAVVRRTSVRPTPVLTVNDLNLDLSTRRVSRAGGDVDLTPIEFSLLELLMRFAGQVVTRKMLCEHVWGFNWDGTTNVIEVHVNRLRGKLDQGRQESIIKTIRGRGYSVAADESGSPDK